jgi:hypothetical protein
MKNLKMKSFIETHKQALKFPKIIYKVSMSKRIAKLIVIRSSIIWIQTFMGRIGSMSKMNIQTSYSQRTNKKS